MSTLDQADIDVMKASKTLLHVFNTIILMMTLLLMGLQSYRKITFRVKTSHFSKILILINPPYAEVGTGADIRQV